MYIYVHIDREHVVGILPHLWVLDTRMITGKKFSALYMYHESSGDSSFSQLFNVAH